MDCNIIPCIFVAYFYTFQLSLNVSVHLQVSLLWLSHSFEDFIIHLKCSSWLFSHFSKIRVVFVIISKQNWTHPDVNDITDYIRKRTVSFLSSKRICTENHYLRLPKSSLNGGSFQGGVTRIVIAGWGASDGRLCKMLQISALYWHLTPASRQHRTFRKFISFEAKLFLGQNIVNIKNMLYCKKLEPSKECANNTSTGKEMLTWKHQ